jgi:two-component system, NtrC family, response regulator AtoC
MPHALVVDDDLNNLNALTELVEREGFSTSPAGTLKDARAHLESHTPDVILIDLFLPDGRGIDILKDLEGGPATDVVLITGNASIETAIEALRVGVTDYLPKPVDIPRLKTILANCARTRELKEEIDSLREKLRKLGHFGPMIGASAPIQRIYDLIARVAPTDATVLLMGESGTGKEMVAQTLHELSKRRKEPFLPLNCGAISPNLIESELFGHERGSFTGANRMHKGYFERSVGGTLFLDEITEMPIELQVKLLRVLETGTIIRVGGDQQVPVDVRVIAATNRSPEDAVTHGKLREDLLYRLKVFPLHLPPLRERGDDVLLLAEHFLWQLNKTEGTAKKLTRPTLERLKTHAWPGNVRELKNVVHRAFILADEEIGPDCLPPEVGGTETFSGPDLHFKVGVSIEEAERRLILATLDHFNGDKKKTADVLGVSLKTLYNRLNAYKMV